jgi:hypothetical protein
VITEEMLWGEFNLAVKKIDYYQGKAKNTDKAFHTVPKEISDKIEYWQGRKDSYAQLLKRVAR